METSVHLILCVQHRSGDRSVRLDCGNAQARPQGQSGGMSSVDQQFAAVFGALVPFLLAVSVVAAGIWTAIAWAYGWRYGGTIEHRGSRPWSPQILPAPTCTRRGLFFGPLPAPVEANLRPRFFVDKVAGRCCGLLVPAPPVAPIPIPPKPRTGATLDGWKFRCLILLGHGMLGSLYRPSSCGCAGTPKRSYGFAVCV